MEKKIKFALGDAPADFDDLASYTFRKKAVFSLLRAPPAEWHESNLENATTWAATLEQFLTRFSDGQLIPTQNGSGTLCARQRRENQKLLASHQENCG